VEDLGGQGPGRRWRRAEEQYGGRLWSSMDLELVEVRAELEVGWELGVGREQLKLGWVASWASGGEVVTWVSVGRRLRLGGRRVGRQRGGKRDKGRWWWLGGRLGLRQNLTREIEGARAKEIGRSSIFAVNCGASEGFWQATSMEVDILKISIITFWSFKKF
jgi:hypothetical protein